MNQSKAESTITKVFGIVLMIVAFFSIVFAMTRPVLTTALSSLGGTPEIMMTILMFSNIWLPIAFLIASIVGFSFAKKLKTFGIEKAIFSKAALAGLLISIGLLISGFLRPLSVYLPTMLSSSSQQIELLNISSIIGLINIIIVSICFLASALIMFLSSSKAKLSGISPIIVIISSILLVLYVVFTISAFIALPMLMQFLISETNMTPQTVSMISGGIASLEGFIMGAVGILMGLFWLLFPNKAIKRASKAF